MPAAIMKEPPMLALAHFLIFSEHRIREEFTQTRRNIQDRLDIETR